MLYGENIVRVRRGKLKTERGISAIDGGVCCKAKDVQWVEVCYRVFDVADFGLGLAGC